jgi:hypothetical protein
MWLFENLHTVARNRSFSAQEPTAMSMDCLTVL